MKSFQVLNEEIVLDNHLSTSQAKRASLRREVLHTDFLTPPVLKESMLVLERLADVKIVAQGGYPEVRQNVFYKTCLSNKAA